MKVKMPAREDAAIDMAPMIDMVFLLLVFFMVASTAAVERVPIKQLPRTAHAKVPEDIKGRMILSIDEDGNLYDDMEMIEIDELAKRIEARMGTGEVPVKKVVIRADDRVRYKDCVDVMKACGEAGATDLIYAAFTRSSE